MQILSLVFQNLSTIKTKLLNTKITASVEGTIDVVRTIFSLICLPLLCGSFLAWSAAKSVSIPSIEDMVLGLLVVYASTFSYHRLLELRPDLNNMSTGEVMITILTDMSLLRALYAPKAWVWMEKWIVYATFWSIFAIGTVQIREANFTKAKLTEQCGLSVRMGLITIMGLWFHKTFGIKMKSYARRIHKVLYDKRYCIGWRLHNYDASNHLD